ncbi:MAG: hypothetical protein IJ848_03340 [Alphaproteobacteria bacterium]|nr:hypothetical protein [Alphaproteobacteria bacterium]
MKRIYLVVCSLVAINCVNIGQASNYNNYILAQENNDQKQYILDNKINEFISKIDTKREWINKILSYAYEEEYDESVIDFCDIKSLEEVLQDFIKYGNLQSKLLYNTIKSNNEQLLQDYDFLLLFREILKLNREINDSKKNKQVNICNYSFIWNSCNVILSCISCNHNATL